MHTYFKFFAILYASTDYNGTLCMYSHTDQHTPFPLTIFRSHRTIPWTFHRYNLIRTDSLSTFFFSIKTAEPSCYAQNYFGCNRIGTIENINKHFVIQFEIWLTFRSYGGWMCGCGGCRKGVEVRLKTPVVGEICQHDTTVINKLSVTAVTSVVPVVRCHAKAWR